MLADEEVRAVQTELRKRHLFHGDSTGEMSPALTAAIRRYQERKGFAPTGLIDGETSASLGIAGHAATASRPFVVDSKGDVRGANGEALPEPLPARWASEERTAAFAHVAADPNPLPIAHAEAETANPLKNKVAAKRRPASRVQPIRPRKDTNPFVAAFTTIDHARKFLFGDADAKKKRRTAKRL